MPKFGSPILLIFLALMLAGCSGYKIASFPDSPEIEEPAESDRLILQEKMHARIHLKSGEVYNGEVVRVSDSEITIGWTGNYGFEEMTYRIEEIEKVEVPATSKAGSVLMSTTGIVALSFTVLLILFAAGGGVGNQG